MPSITRPTQTSTDPTALPTLLRSPDRALPYPWPKRLLDVIAGRRDSRRGLAGPLQQHTLEHDQTTWLRHNAHQLHERLHAEQLRHDALALPLRREQEALPGRIKDTKRELATADKDLKKLPASPQNPNRRLATEAATPDAVVLARRQREHDTALLAPARSRLARAQAELAQLRARRREVEATLAALARVHQERTGRLQEFHQRRAHTYERAYLRRAKALQADLA